MSEETIRALFVRAAAAKAEGNMQEANNLFLSTVANGVPDGVRVIYLFAESAVPANLEVASYYDVLVLEFEGEEEQTMPVPLLVQFDEQLAQSLFAAAEFRQLEEQDDDDWDAEDDVSWGGDEQPGGEIDIVDWGCEPWDDLVDDYDDDD